METKVKRQSNFELLRIIAMALIVAHHFAVHGIFNFSIESISINRLWIQLFIMGGKVGVNIFILISGYFLIKDTELKISKTIKLYLQIYFYSLVLFFIAVITGLEPFKISSLIHNLLPLIYGEWWFATTYFVLYLIHPYLNKLLNSLSKKDYLHLVILLTIFWSIIPTLTNKLFESNMFVWFTYLYILAGYLRLHYPKKKINSKKYIFIALGILLATFASAIVLDIVGKRIEIIGYNSNFFFGTQKINILIVCILLILGFSKLDIKYNKFINAVASTTFGIYLIHDDYNIRNYIWLKLFKNATYKTSKYLIPYSILVVIIVFVTCSLIDYLRIRLVEKNSEKLIDKISNKIDKSIKKFLSLKLFNNF